MGIDAADNPVVRPVMLAEIEAAVRMEGAVVYSTTAITPRFVKQNGAQTHFVKEGTADHFVKE